MYSQAPDDLRTEYNEPSAIDVAKKPHCTAGPAAMSLVGQRLPTGALQQVGSYPGTLQDRRGALVLPYSHRFCCADEVIE
jgi:hypothetical protein